MTPSAQRLATDGNKKGTMLTLTHSEADREYLLTDDHNQRIITRGTWEETVTFCKKFDLTPTTTRQAEFAQFGVHAR